MKTKVPVPSTFQLRDPQEWGYPDGLADRIVAMLKEQGAIIIGANQLGDVLFLEYKSATWVIGDNDGKLLVEKLNQMDTVQCVSICGIVTQDVQEYATIMVHRLLDAMNGRTVDYEWRPI